VIVGLLSRSCSSQRWPAASRPGHQPTATPSRRRVVEGSGDQACQITPDSGRPAPHALHLDTGPSPVHHNRAVVVDATKTGATRGQAGRPARAERGSGGSVSVVLRGTSIMLLAVASPMNTGATPTQVHMVQHLLLMFRAQAIVGSGGARPAAARRPAGRWERR